jgi:hypothetical protein
MSYSKQLKDFILTIDWPCKLFIIPGHKPIPNTPYFCIYIYYINPINLVCIQTCLKTDIHWTLVETWLLTYQVSSCVSSFKMDGPIWSWYLDAQWSLKMHMIFLKVLSLGMNIFHLMIAILKVILEMYVLFWYGDWHMNLGSMPKYFNCNLIFTLQHPKTIQNF